MKPQDRETPRPTSKERSPQSTMNALLLLTMTLIGQDGIPKDAFEPDPAWKPLGKAIWFDARNRQLMIRARVVLREGYLEHLLCLEQTKEHESILATEAPPRLIHAGLLLTGADVGRPVKFLPKFEPPAGTPIHIDVLWKSQDGKTNRADARTWIKDEKNGKTLAVDWVFAGSQQFVDEQTNRDIYAADGGDLITVANFMSAILDVPFASTTNDAERSFVANTTLIPTRNTFVTLVLRPEKTAPKPPATPKPAR